MPKRIQRRRTKGWKMPENCVCVTRPTVFGNPWQWRKAREAGYCGTDDELKAFAVQIYREWLTNNARHGHGHDEQLAKLLARIKELRGKDLACWCPLDKPCHADVLLEIANR
jgi:hypothetical protein